MKTVSFDNQNSLVKFIFYKTSNDTDLKNSNDTDLNYRQSNDQFKQWFDQYRQSNIRQSAVWYGIPCFYFVLTYFPVFK
jgi:hypothetical protein